MVKNEKVYEYAKGNSHLIKLLDICYDNNVEPIHCFPADEIGINSYIEVIATKENTRELEKVMNCIFDDDRFKKNAVVDIDTYTGKTKVCFKLTNDGKSSYDDFFDLIGAVLLHKVPIANYDNFDLINTVRTLNHIKPATAEVYEKYVEFSFVEVQYIAKDGDEIVILDKKDVENEEEVSTFINPISTTTVKKHKLDKFRERLGRELIKTNFCKKYIDKK